MRFGEPEYNILLCGCKKYNNYQQNGILIIDINSNTEDFFDTDNFEVYCFCPILYINNTDNNKEILYTDYFLVGGFSCNKREGMIKLFKLINNEETNFKTKIEFKQDIVFENTNIILKKEINNNNDVRDKSDIYIFSGFERNVSCITQSKINGNIYVTCWDGLVYSLTPPNIRIYLEWDLEKL